MCGSQQSTRLRGGVGSYEAIWQPGLIQSWTLTLEVNVMGKILTPFVLGISVSTLALTCSSMTPEVVEPFTHLALSAACTNAYQINGAALRGTA